MPTHALNSLDRGFIFLQDNEPKYRHRPKHIENSFFCCHVTLLDWPSQTPNITIFEDVWAEMKHRLLRKNAKNSNEKFAHLEEEWKNNPQCLVGAKL